MKRHAILWFIAVLFFLLALTVYLFRAGDTPGPVQDAENALEHALSLLKVDPAALDIETQAAVRFAAAFVEQGQIQNAQGYYILALQYQREGNLVGAEALYKRAIALQSDWSLPYTGLGNLLGRYAFGRTDEAKEVLRKAIALDPEDGRPHNILAVLLRSEKFYDEAEREALRAIELDPYSIAAQNNYGNLLVEMGRFDEAEEHYRIATELRPEHPKPYYNLACLFSLEGRTEDALDYLRLALKRAADLRREAAYDPDLENIRHLEEFQRLVYDAAGIPPPSAPNMHPIDQ